MITESQFIWMDGRRVPWKDATIHVLTHSLHYGLAVFEGCRSGRRNPGTASDPTRH